MTTLNYRNIRKAALALSQTDERVRNAFLKNLSREIVQNEKKILAANARDVKKAKTKKLETAFVERLVLDTEGIELLRQKLASIQKLKSGVGEIIERKKMRADFTLTKVRVPLGVLAVIYEARPEVTIDVAGLCVKSGNAAILKGGSEALETNKALYECIQSALKRSGFVTETITFIATGDRSVTDGLLQRHDAVDLVIARGGYAMVKTIMAQSKIPVLAHSAGGARIYVDKSADLKMAERILVNAKITKPSACNAVDTILVHKSIAKKFVPQITRAMEMKGVTVKKSINWDTETLSLVVGIKVVKDVGEAVEFINEHTKTHTEGIVAKDKKVIDTFTRSIDAAALFVNASTRLHDGYVFGLGSEMGISTSKLHARGPVGLRELTTYKWEVYGSGNIR